MCRSLLHSRTAQTTDEGGFATFSNLPEGGTYTITASKDGYTFRPESRTFANLTDDTSGSFGAVRATASIGGRVLLDGATPLAGVKVTLGGASEASAVTDAQGACTFDGLEAGGDYHRAEMVRSFIVSLEYRRRFGQ